MADCAPGSVMEAHGLRAFAATRTDLRLTAANGTSLILHAFDLYENVPARFDAAGVQRLAPSLASPDDPAIETVTPGPEGLTIQFDDGERVLAPFDWLLARLDAHAPGQPSRRPPAVGGPPSFDYAEFMTQDQARLSALVHVTEFGWVRLRGAPCEPGEVLRAIAAFGYVRETNYGRLFDVRVEADTANLAFTDRGLELHTDNPYRAVPPALQVLHCLQAAPGGETLLADGFAAAETLRAEDPAAFDSLTRHLVRFAWQDATTILEAQAPIISLGHDGQPNGIRFNHRSLASPGLPVSLQTEWRRAYRAFARILSRPGEQTRFQMAPGDVIIFDNERMLHGRTAFPAGAGRWLQGAYADRDGLLSSIAHLARIEADRTVTAIEALFTSPEAREPYGEDLSIAAHMLQTAHLAAKDGAPETLVAAALLHDIGWPLGEDPHELSGAARVSAGFGEAVAAPIRAHVAAKRWLVATDPDYAATLSAESQRTLVIQGGAMTAEECTIFERHEGFAGAVRLRRYDDAAKDPQAICPPFAAYTSLLHRLAAEHAAHKGELE